MPIKSKKTQNDLIVLASENSRYKLKALAKILSKSPQRIKYNLKQLLSPPSIILNHPHCIFDYSYFGLILFRVYFKNSFISEKEKQKILGILNDNQYITAIYELSGEFDLVIELAAHNPSRINKELKNLAEYLPALNDYKLVLNIVTHLYPRNYLLEKFQLSSEFEKQLIIGGDRQQVSFNKNELSIMKNLLDNPNIRLSSLAKSSGINIKTAISILNSLKKKKIIKGFKQALNNESLGIEKTRLFLKLHNLSKEREDELLDFFLETKEITQINKTVGDWDMEVDLESLSKPRIKLLINNLRENFKDIIANFNREEFNEYYKKTYLPTHIFNSDVRSLLA